MNVVVHYHEIALKGKNRPYFIEKLARNLRRATSDIPGVTVRALSGRLALAAPDDTSWERLRERIACTFGVVNFARVFEVAPNLEALSSAATQSLLGLRFASFRVRTKRSHKGFEQTSMEVDRQVGSAIRQATGARVDLELPELTLFVEILRDRIFFYVEKLPGPGGLPVGVSGRVLTLLSGGIDSPVAASRMMKRGCQSWLVHFHAFPLQDRTSIDKVVELSRVLTRLQHRTRLLLVPFGPVQQTIVASCPAPLRVVLYRRCMLRIAEALARRCRAAAVVTGESLGQVASQTLRNLSVIDDAATGPVLRPLVGMDKDEITREARRLGTFEISTLPDQDCCQLFVPRNPATAARLEAVRQAEAALDLEDLVGSATESTKQKSFSFPPDSTTPSF